MGYFANSLEAYEYQELYCDRCVHLNEEYGCPCWDAHEFFCYDECNNDDSVLHKMIPIDGVDNKQCIFFVEE